MTKVVAVIALIGVAWAAWIFVLNPALRAPSIAAPTHTTLALHMEHDNGLATGQAQEFLSSWAAGHYDAMYGDLSSAARHRITRAAFISRYKGIMAEATISGIAPVVDTVRIHAADATASYHVTLSTTAVGPISYASHMPLHDQHGTWRVNWTPDLIFPGLGSAYRVHRFTLQARRGAIVDRLGRPLALQGYVLPVGVVPEYIHNEKSLLSFLSSWLRMPASQIQAMIHEPWAIQNPSDFVPIATVSSLQWNTVPLAVQAQQQDNGLDVKADIAQQTIRRLYPHGPLAASLLGYVRASDNHGAAGLESWGDSYLSGSNGARLAIATAPDYAYVNSVIKERSAQNGATLHLTLDTTLQQAAEYALAGKVGSVVALRPSDGAVLAMASAPSYDPNLFASGLSADGYRALIDNPQTPLLNRATMGQYPLGSVFKIVTMAAAMEKAGLTIDTLKDCPGIWYGLGHAYAKRDWLPQGHGIVSMHEALVQSCDTYFYQVGQQLDRMNHTLVPDYARSWGFGMATGIEGLSEGAGLVPDPLTTVRLFGRPWMPGNAVDLAIGQGDLEVTPLQVAQMLGALGDNGVMHRPYVVQSVTANNGSVLRSYVPVVTRTLPLSAAHRQDILSAMLGVTAEPRGTATNIFAGFPWPVAGKTGTAQTGDGRQPHAWFAALAPANHPTIALVVMVEHGGEGATVAAPLARRILQTYFTKDRDLVGGAAR